MNCRRRTNSAPADVPPGREKYPRHLRSTRRRVRLGLQRDRVEARRACVRHHCRAALVRGSIDRPESARRTPPAPRSEDVLAVSRSRPARGSGRGSRRGRSARPVFQRAQLRIAVSRSLGEEGDAAAAAEPSGHVRTFRIRPFVCPLAVRPGMNRRAHDQPMMDKEERRPSREKKDGAARSRSEQRTTRPSEVDGEMKDVPRPAVGAHQLDTAVRRRASDAQRRRRAPRNFTALRFPMPPSYRLIRRWRWPRE